MAISYSPLTQGEKDEVLKLKSKGLSTQEIMSTIQEKREAGPSYLQKVAMGFSEGYQKEKTLWEEKKKLDPERTDLGSSLKDIAVMPFTGGVGPVQLSDSGNYVGHLFRSVMSPISSAVGEAVSPAVQPIANKAMGVGKDVFSALPEDTREMIKGKATEAYSWYNNLDAEKKNKLKIMVGNLDAALIVGDVAGLKALVEGTTKKIGKSALGDVAQIMNQRFKALSMEKVVKEGTESLMKVPGKISDSVAGGLGKVSAVMNTGKIADFKKSASEIGRTLVSKVYGLDEDTMKAVIDNPEFFRMAKDGILNKKNTVDTLYNVIQKRFDAIDDVGTKYAPLRQNTKIFGTPIKEVDNFLTKSGLKLEGNQIVKIGPRTSRLTNGDLSTLNEALQPMISGGGFRTASTTDQWLNVRQMMDKLIRWDSPASKDGQNFIKSLRGIINDKAHSEVPELAKLDIGFKKEKEVLDGLKDYFVMKGGKAQLQKNAMGKLMALVKDEKSDELKFLKQLMPDIDKDIKALHAIQDYNRAKGFKVGMYAQAGIIGGLATGSLTGAIGTPLAIMVATHPSILVKILEAYGKRKGGGSSGIFTKLSRKIEQGIKLTPEELDKVGEAVEGLDLTLKNAKQSSMFGENRTVGLKGGKQGTPGVDYPAPLPKVADEAMGGADEALMQEAKKYKSAEEFVKAQGTPVYHGTSLSRSENINKEGFKEIYSPRLYGAVKSPTTYFSETPDVAKIYAEDKAMALKDKESIIETFIDFNKGKQLDLTKRIPDWIKKHRDAQYNDLDMWDTTPTNVWSLLDNSKVKDLIQEKGYNIVRFKERGVDTLGNGIAVFDKGLIKTKSQLTDIWNKANAN